MASDLSWKILIVEDQALLALELDYVLSEMGHEVLGSAMDAGEAMELAARTAPEIALVDMNLRDGASGPTVARHLRDQYGTAVIYLTANPEQVPVTFAGALGVLVKPFEPETLAEVIRFAGNWHDGEASCCAPGRLHLAPGVDGAAGLS